MLQIPLKTNLRHHTDDLNTQMDTLSSTHKTDP